jgi:hypothetical protein
MNSYKFDKPNEPNAGKLIESLRHLGYDNYVAVADIVDNSVDAEASIIKIRVNTTKGEFRISIADNGNGMDRDTLDEALRLGSISEKDPVSDLGKFGMGLVTAGLSLSRKTTVISKQNGSYLTSIVDLDEVIQTNKFCKYLQDSTADEEVVLDSEFPDSQSGTIVIFDKCDGIKNTNVTQFVNSLRKHLGRVHRYFLSANKEIYINEQMVPVVDPLELSNTNTEIFCDEEYPVTIKSNGKERQEMIRVRIVLIPVDVSGGQRDLETNIPNQGFYIMRNMREIRAHDNLDMFVKHNELNRLRGEIFFTGDMDEFVGIDFTKRDIVLDQSLYDQLAQYIVPQCRTIRRQEQSKRRLKESEEISELHKQAEKYIDLKAKLLITPKPNVEKRRGHTNHTGTVKPGNGDRIRKHFAKVQEGSATRCRIEPVKMGVNGPIYQADLQGRVVCIAWNIDHPFYQRFVLDQESDGRLVTAVDYLVYSMASAELHTLDDDQRQLLYNFLGIVSSNVRTLLA